MPTEYYAHSVDGSPQESWEPLLHHLESVAQRTSRIATKFDSASWGFYSGLWHDLGKYRSAFQRRLHGHPERAPHASVGAALAAKYGLSPAAAVIAAHHTGLADHVEAKAGQPRSLRDAIAEGSQWLDECTAAAPNGLISPVQEKPLPPAHLQRLATGSMEYGSAADLWVRMLFSALVDADRLETEAFYEPEKASVRHSNTSLSDLSRRLDEHLDAIPQKNLAINAIRRRVLDDCRVASVLEQGCFSLSVPTGGGKTLSALSFALRHATRHALERVVVVAPFTSIIDQNAAVIREILGDENVLEHHSGTIDSDEDDSRRAESLKRRKLLVENWDAPIVVTTAVQFFESLFSNKPTSARKLHNVVRSVVILDEAQTIPVDYLHCIVGMLKELMRAYRCSVVLSTATQPALKQRPALRVGLPDVRELMSNPDALVDRLRRVRVIWPEQNAITPYDQVARMMNDERQVLAIVHLRADARQLAEQVESEGLVHLSTRMCPMHRKSAIARIRRLLATGQTCRVVSTQIVEAGVDIDFPVVFRAMAGLDSLTQAAGRCNRNGALRDSRGELQQGRLFVFRAPTKPPPGVLREGLRVAESMLQETSDIDLFSAATHEEYFRRLYAHSDIDSKRIVPLQGQGKLATIAGLFRMIDDGDQQAVVVPYDEESMQLVVEYRARMDRSIVRRLQQHSVSLRSREIARLLTEGVVEELDGFGYVLSAPFYGLYHDLLGLQVEGDLLPDAEALVC